MLKQSVIAIMLASAVALPIYSTALQAQSSTAAQGDLAKISAHLRAAKTMTATFVQTDRTVQTLTGTLTLKQPGKIRFQYQKGVPLLIVGDGSALTMIDYEVNQVQRWPIKNSPLGALLNPERDLAKYGKLVPTGDDNVLSIDIKDPKRPEYGTINMIFVRNAAAPAGLQLAGWVALDSQNKRTSIRLSGQQYNVAVSDSKFRWTDPRRSTGPKR